jgi:nitrate/TMAO reductase-like tetraheme cytochrome c subunit
MKFALCTDCHQDYHKAQFVVDDVTENCANCHTENGFTPSLFTIEIHNKTKFQITGAHLAIPCQSCHYQQNQWQFKGTRVECISCHKNIHEKELKAEFLPNDSCTACHQTENWSVISFDHSKTFFQLLGKHKEILCGSCHRKKENDTTTIILRSTKKECESCHKDVHIGQFKIDEVSDCSRCHAFENWKPEKFDHSKTKFNLEGAHEKVECARCHPKVEMNGNIFTKFKLEEFKCATCHKK